MLVDWISFHPVFPFYSFQYDAFLMYVPLGSTVAFTAPTCLRYILGKHGCARNQGGCQPAAAKSPLVLPGILYQVCCCSCFCCFSLNMKPYFLPNISSTPCGRPAKRKHTSHTAAVDTPKSCVCSLFILVVTLNWNHVSVLRTTV